MQSNIVHLKTCESTMLEARALARAGAAHLTTVRSDAQTAGRGRQGRVWHSEPGSSLLFTTVLHSRLESASLGLVPLLVGVALLRAVAAQGVACALKWPNDLLSMDARKLAGILLEHDALSKTVLVGVGLNIKIQAWDLPAGAQQPAALLEFLQEANTDALLNVFLQELAALFARLVAGDAAGVVAAWSAHDVAHGQNVRLEFGDGRVVRGLACGINETGALLLRDAEQHLHAVHSGELRLRFDAPSG